MTQDGQGALPTQIMGVLNITPDSFSDGGETAETATALVRARALRDSGAHWIDVGGESTRPGSLRVDPEEEQQRILATVTELAAEGVPLSIDTLNSATAELALAAGARMINDVSGGLNDPRLLRVTAESDAQLVLGHWRGIPDQQHSRADYSNVVTEVAAALEQRAVAALAAGVRAEQIILDPGLGFDKTTEQGWQLLSQLPVLSGLGFPVLVGVSRKRMLADLLPPGTPVTERDLPTAVVSVLAAQQGAWGVRVHDVAGTRLALDTLGAWNSASQKGAQI